MFSTFSKSRTVTTLPQQVRDALLAHAQRLLADLALARPYQETERFLDELVPWFSITDEAGESLCFTFYPERLTVSNFGAEVLFAASWDGYSPAAVVQWLEDRAPYVARRPGSAH